jgi:Fic family protein
VDFRLERYISDGDKLRWILRETGMTRARLARALDVGYLTLYRWLDKGVKPHRGKSQDIDELFKDAVDLRPVVYGLRKSLPNPLRLLQSNPAIREQFILRMTFHSNAIEGNRMTLQETAMAMEGKVVRGKEMFEMMEAINHKNAVLHMLQAVRPGFLVTEAYILKLHEIMLYNFNRHLPGKYRTGYVNLTNTEKTVPNAQLVPVKMSRLLKSINAYGKDPLGKAAADHFEFESIHPFFDGNGRVGRLLLATQLLSRGLAPAIIEVDDQMKYYTALGKADNGDLRNLTQMVCDAVLKGCALIQEKPEKAKAKNDPRLGTAILLRRKN